METTSLGNREPFDLVVVGAGVAGLFAALCAASEARVCVIGKGELLASASSWAQGGIASAMTEDDSPTLHAADTHAAGRAICRPSAVTVLTEEAPARIVDLIELGVPFDDDLGLEGGHSRRRIVHADGAATGARVSRVLAERALTHPRIEVIEHCEVSDLWPGGEGCAGVVTERGPIRGRAVLLATGGYAALYSRTTNPRGSTGDGIALAHRHGAAVADMEFVQFHPTALAASGLLLSEALRGEGALLLDEHGERFTDELAPRDVVARAIDERGTALLDLRPIDRSRFPTLMQRIHDEGYDPSRQPVPVAPAAHYTLGGIVTDLDGRTDVPGLLAAGECAATGVHGANRLASNSLLECLVFGRRAALAALDEPLRRPGPPPVPQAPAVADELLRDRLWCNAGLVRDAAGLSSLAGASHPVARLIAVGALAREESRGGHFRVDFPAEDTAWLGHVVQRPGRGPALESWS